MTYSSVRKLVAPAVRHIAYGARSSMAHDALRASRRATQAKLFRKAGTVRRAVGVAAGVVGTGAVVHHARKDVKMSRDELSLGLMDHLKHINSGLNVAHKFDSQTGGNAHKIAFAKGYGKATLKAANKLRKTPISHLMRGITPTHAVIGAGAIGGAYLTHKASKAAFNAVHNRLSKVGPLIGKKPIAASHELSLARTAFNHSVFNPGVTGLFGRGSHGAAAFGERTRRLAKQARLTPKSGLGRSARTAVNTAKRFATPKRLAVGGAIAGGALAIHAANRVRTGAAFGKKVEASHELTQRQKADLCLSHGVEALELAKTPFEHALNVAGKQPVGTFSNSFRLGASTARTRTARLAKQAELHKKIPFGQGVRVIARNVRQNAKFYGGAAALGTSVGLTAGLIMRHKLRKSIKASHEELELAGGALIKHASNGLKSRGVGDYLRMRFAKAAPAAGRLAKRFGPGIAETAAIGATIGGGALAVHAANRVRTALKKTTAIATSHEPTRRQQADLCLGFDRETIEAGLGGIVKRTGAGIAGGVAGTLAGAKLGGSTGAAIGGVAGAIGGARIVRRRQATMPVKPQRALHAAATVHVAQRMQAQNPGAKVRINPNSVKFSR